MQLILSFIDWSVHEWLAVAALTVAVGSAAMALFSLQRFVSTRRRTDRAVQELTAQQQAFLDLLRPEVLFSGTDFDHKLTACVLNVVRAEMDRYAAPHAGRQDRRDKTSERPRRRDNNQPATDASIAKPDSEPLQPTQLAPFRDALTTLLHGGRGTHDPDGYLEVAISDILSHLPGEQSVDQCSRAVRQLNHCYEQSDHDVLREKNFLRVRHLRSVTGEPNLRVGIKLEAVTPFLKEPLKGR